MLGSNFPSPPAMAAGAPVAIAMVVLVHVIGVAAEPAAASLIPSRVAPKRSVAVLLSPQKALRAPRSEAPRLATVAARRPITGARTALPVLARATDRRGARWLRVMLPGRPNGSRGWITEKGTRLGATGWQIRIGLRARRVSIYRHGRRVQSFRAVIGKPSTPTPTGGFFVEETLAMRPGRPGGPFALALSARSRELRSFEGGPGQVALHGRDALGGRLGAAESHGCIRLARGDIEWLARRIGPGVPVTIRHGFPCQSLAESEERARRSPVFGR